jgi:hypothetical protein
VTTEEAAAIVRTGTPYGWKIVGREKRPDGQVGFAWETGHGGEVAFVVETFDVPRIESKGSAKRFAAHVFNTLSTIDDQCARKAREAVVEQVTARTHTKEA